MTGALSSAGDLAGGGGFLGAAQVGDEDAAQVGGILREVLGRCAEGGGDCVGGRLGADEVVLEGAVAVAGAAVSGFRSVVLSA